RRHGLIRQFFDLVENWRSPSGVLRIDNHNAVRRDKDCGVSAAAGQHVKVVLQFLYINLVGLLLRGENDGQCADNKQSRQNCNSFHNYSKKLATEFQGRTPNSSNSGCVPEIPWLDS